MTWQEEMLKKWLPKPKVGVGQLITDAVRDRLAREFKGEVLFRESMKEHTSIRIGGMADVFARPQNVEDLRVLLKIANEENIPFTFLGWGSNTLVRDAGIRGFVVALMPGFSKVEVVADEADTMDVMAEAGVKIGALVELSREKSLTGVEALIGIPGSIGGAVVMNAGARGVEIKDVVREVTILTLEGEIKSISREKLEFSYRHLKLPRGAAVLSAVFRLNKGNQEEIQNQIRQYQLKRAETQPLNFPSLGSVFKNPQPQKKNEVPLSAGQIIDEAGLKNIRVGGARISEKHGNFIVNEKDAKAKDVLVLINLVKEKVKEKTGIQLETEVKVLGEE